MSSLTVTGSVGLGLVVGWSSSHATRVSRGPRQRYGLLVVVLAAAAEVYAFVGWAGLVTLLAGVVIGWFVHRYWMRRLALAVRNSDSQEEELT